MAIQFQCPSCRSTLRVPDNLAGRKVRCPKCRGVADVGYASSAPSSEPSDLKPIEEDLPVPSPAANSALQGAATNEPEEVGIRVRKPAASTAPADEDWQEDWEEVKEETSSPARTKSGRGEAISARPQGKPPPVELEDEEDEEKAPRPRRLKRRLPRRTKINTSSPRRAWFWVRWVAAAVVYLLIGSGISIHMILTGHLDELIVQAISWAIMMPVSLVLFFISMFLGNAIVGGIDFGDIRTAIPKAIFLLAPINAFYAFFYWYIGFLAAAPFWIFGLMFLFELDVFESWIMIVINWFLNVGANLLVGLIVLSMIHGAEMEREKNSPDDLGDDQIVAPVDRPPPDFQRRFRR